MVGFQLKHVFYTITNLQGSQTGLKPILYSWGFTPLQTYKVLKRYQIRGYSPIRFTPLQTYKVLKPSDPY